ncbi:MAG: transposase [Nitrosospira sp.]|nr:transposase [Nitrosospira sp.]MDN5935589.1 transposase [Nitrosospira sp.]
MQTSLGSTEMETRTKRDSMLMKAHALIDWEGLRDKVAELYRRETNRGGGQSPMDALVMFKAVLLGQWHSLSDSNLEEALRVRIDFMQFCGLDVSDALPDETTLCRFRNRLITSGRLAELLAGVNAQLQRHGLMVKHAHGAVIDATLVQSATRLKRDMITEPDAASTLGLNEDPEPLSSATRSSGLARCNETRRTDPDAMWIKRGTPELQRNRITSQERSRASRH